VRIGDRRFRVIGVPERLGGAPWASTCRTGHHPVSQCAAALQHESLFRILIQARDTEPATGARVRWRAMHRRAASRARRNVTVITQDAVLATFNRIYLHGADLDAWRAFASISPCGGRILI